MSDEKPPKDALVPAQQGLLSSLREEIQFLLKEEDKRGHARRVINGAADFLLGKLGESLVDVYLDDGEGLSPGGPTPSEEEFETLETLMGICRQMFELQEEFFHQVKSGDIAAVVRAQRKARQSTYTAEKRAMLRNAAINAFDPEVYKQGLAIRMMRLLDEVEFADVVILRRIKDTATPNDPHKNVPLPHTDIRRLGLPIFDESLLLHHLDVLQRHGLIRRFKDYHYMTRNEDGTNVLVLGLGHALLRYISDPAWLRPADDQAEASPSEQGSHPTPQGG